MVFRAVSLVLLLMIGVHPGHAQQKLATGVYRTIASSSFKYIDEVGDTLYLDPVAICTPVDFKTAEMAFGYAGRPVVQVELNDAGREKFTGATRTNVGKKLAIIGNGRLLSAPVVQSEIAGGMFEVSGSFSVEEAKGLAERIRKDIPGWKMSAAELARTEQELRMAISSLESGLLTQDTNRLKDILHSDLSLGHSNGWIENKAALLQHLSSGYLVYQGISPVGNMEISTVGAATRIRRNIKVKGIADKKKFDLELNILEVWLQEDGKWKLWSRQSITKNK